MEQMPPTCENKRRGWGLLPESPGRPLPHTTWATMPSPPPHAPMVKSASFPPKVGLKREICHIAATAGQTQSSRAWKIDGLSAQAHKPHAAPDLRQEWSPCWVLKEETDRTGSILKAGLHLGPDRGLWAICPGSLETTNQLENQAPWVEEPQGSYLDSLSPKRIPYLSV